MEKVAEGDNAC